MSAKGTSSPRNAQQYAMTKRLLLWPPETFHVQNQL